MKNDFFLAEMKARAWAMMPEALDGFFRRIAALSPEAIAQAGKPAAAAPRKLEVKDGTATIRISGVLLKKVPAWFSYFGIEATGYGDIIRDLDESLSDEGVTAIKLLVESPGGIVDGVHETAQAIFNANKKKPLEAEIEDIGASAAYWLAAQASKISANLPAEVGSIGVYMVVYDESAAAEEMGVKVKVLRSGKYKGTGVPGAPVTDAELEPLQETIDGLAEIFTKAVARGRNISLAKAEELATGRTWLAEEARALGLIDEVSGIQDATASPGGPAAEIFSLRKEKSMEQEPKATPPVDLEAMKSEAAEAGKKAERERLSSLLAAFPKHKDFALAQFSNGASVEAAKVAYVDVLTAENAEKDAALAAEQAKSGKLEADLAKKAAAPKGAEPLEHGEASEGGKDFTALAKERAAEKKIPFSAAAREIEKERPELYAALRPAR